MNKPIVYVAGPFAANPTHYTKLAETIGTYVQKMGWAPFVPHTSISSGIYGNDTIPEEREEGTQSTLSIVRCIANEKDNKLFIITFENGSMSKGTTLEHNLWLSIQGQQNITMYTEKEWIDICSRVK